jgi:hypothetical protein
VFGLVLASSIVAVLLGMSRVATAMAVAIALYLVALSAGGGGARLLGSARRCWVSRWQQCSPPSCSIPIISSSHRTRKCSTPICCPR